MLAVSAGRRLALLDPQTLRSTSAPPSPSKQTALDVEFTALAWANPTVANSRLYIATRGAIRQYDSTGHFEKAILNDPTISRDDPVSAIAVKTEEDVFLARRSKVCRLNCETGSVEDVIDLNEALVSCLCLSKDAMRLAIAFSDQCTVLDISSEESSSATISGISACPAVSFHSHSSRLLLISGRYLSAYDVSDLAESEPLDPTLRIPLGSSTSVKEVIGIACSPFSATLVAVACKGGAVFLVDLEREKGPFKTLDMKASLSSIAFSADGANVLLGTETGQLLVLDLRGLDKPPKKITVTADGKRVVGIAVQKKSKATISKAPNSPVISTTKSAKPTSPKSSKPLASHDLNVKKPSLPHRAPGSSTTDSAKSSNPLASPPTTRASRVTSTRNPSGTPAKTRKASTTASKPTPGRKASTSVTPAKGGLRGRENAHLGVSRTLAAETSQDRMESLSTLLSRKKADGSSALSSKPSDATASNPTLSRLRKSSLAGKSTTSSSRSSASVASRTFKPTLSAETRTRTGSSASTGVASVISARKIFPRKEEYGEGTASPAGTRTRSPSPDFDDGLPSPTTTLPSMPKQRAAMDEVASGVTVRSKSKGRKSPEHRADGRQMQDDHQFIDVDLASPQEYDEEIDTEKSFRAEYVSASADSSAVQLSPLRGAGLRQTPPRPDHFNFNMDPSNRVEDFLKGVFKDAIYDFQQETRSGLLGLHLDVLKMGRRWKQDMKDVFDDFVDEDEGGGIAELKRLREENRRLREEVARLKACV
ncbi:hypothetical protein SCHPADRAFT_927543 [Schizopora paradoxa]|uniref:WD40 repeat-like protein n=1 Tax=Schizopora paradoxa TaxID=27342 RepID=A0A0H2RZC6_9AGAM|nr:hypothetical protein SCHPADRAFT_927543 [Schizopora paradoxa]